MKNNYFKILVAAFLFCTAGVSAQTGVDSVKVDDTRINGTTGKEDTNYYDVNSTWRINVDQSVVSKVSISDFKTYTSAQISKAELRIFGKEPSTQGIMDLKEMDASQVDLSVITWNIALGVTTESTPFATIDINQSADALYTIDITDFIKDKLDAGKDFAYLMESDSTLDVTIRNSNHATPIYQPTILLTLLATGVEDVEIEQFSIVPNPAQSDITVSRLAVGSVINIMSMTGKVVKGVIADGTEQIISVSDLAEGIYIVQVGNVAKKLVVK